MLLSILLWSFPVQGADVPLSLYRNGDWPNGLELGESTGISFGDYDADGWPDLFSFDSGNLWRNVEGRTWVLATNVNHLVPPGTRYGASFGDYDADGWPDLGTEPRQGPGDSCFHLLRNLGAGAAFVDVAGDPAILDFQPCAADSETIGWADVDGDADLDMFLPIYPPAVTSIGNKFLHNRGPTGPGGAHRFTEEALAAGLDNPPGNARPEGVFWFDADADGDLELYSNGALYQNLSGYDAPRFEFLEADSSGIRNRNIVDEGVYFCDYDRDGDEDLLISFTQNRGLRIYEAYGDGSYFATDTTIIENYLNGASYGLHVADWDLDGDLDFGAAGTFRENEIAQTGLRYFRLASTNIDPNHLRSAAPAWGDFDRDGDPDLALANGIFGSYLYQNDSYAAATPWSTRRHLRVRVLRDSAAATRGLETEYGASVQLYVRGEEQGPRRQLTVSSASGYINQNEYALSFALPEVDVPFDLVVDFPSLPEQGYYRVDKSVNPVLAGLRLRDLGQRRELAVFRSGAVELAGCRFEPARRDDGFLLTSSLLITPSQSVPLPDPTTAGVNEYVGLEIDTTPAAAPLRLAEVTVDGLLIPPPACGGATSNLRLWDVTVPGAPRPVAAWLRSMDPRNRRGRFPLDARLEPGRRYRLVALVGSYRMTPIAAPLDRGEFLVTGGLQFTDLQPCKGRGAARAALDPAQTALAVRLRADGARRWSDLGQGTLSLTASGETFAGSPLLLQLRSAPPFAPVRLVSGRALACAGAHGLTVVPRADRIYSGLRTDGRGDLTIAARWPAGLQAGEPQFLQMFAADPAAPSGFAASNALAALAED